MPVFTDDQEPIRTNPASNPGGFTGGGGGGGIAGISGGGGSFDGFAPGGFGANGFGSALQRKRHYTMAGDVSQRGVAFNGGSVSTAPAAPGYAYGGPVGGGPPGPTDTQPAMLTPGEFVVNRRAASDPRNAALLEQMNGGPGGPSMGMGMPSQGLSREALVELLQVLLGGGGGDQMCPQCAGQGCGMCMGGRVPGYKHGGWVLPVAALAAITAPLWAPAAAGALGLGAASGAGAGAAGAGAAGAGATTIGSGTAAGLSVGPTAAVPGLAHTANTGLLGTLTRTVQMHPGLVKGGEMAYGAAQDQRDQREQGMMQREQDSNDAVQRYLMARQQSESVPGYAIGGFVGPTWAKPGGMSPFIAVRPGGGGGGPLAPPTHTGAPPVAGPGNLPMNWANPGAMAGMAEAGARDANDYASGVYRQAQLAGADPGAQAAYRLRALAGAGRGSAEALSKYRTDNAAAEQQRLFDLYKQSKDFEYQAALKRIH